MVHHQSTEGDRRRGLILSIFGTLAFMTPTIIVSKNVGTTKVMDMSTTVFIADPVINQYLHVPLENSLILILCGLIINGIILLYIIRSVSRIHTNNHTT